MVTAAFGSAHILFLSTPSARRATWYNYINKSTRPIISIHALREEGDRLTLPWFRGYNISIHALREEGDRRRQGDDHG